MSGSGSPQRSLVPAEERLRDLGIQLPPAPTPFGAYVPAVQTGNLLFLSGMLPTVGHEPRVLGCLGKDVDVDSARSASRIAALNALAVRQAASRHSRSGMSCRSSRSSNCDYWRAFGAVADGASELLRDVVGEAKMSCRLSSESPVYHSVYPSSWNSSSKYNNRANEPRGGRVKK